jgi:hypothetical protein
VDIGYTDINIDGEFVGMIQYYFSDGITCDEDNAVNVFQPAGSHLLTADSPKGYHWEGQVNFNEGVCGTIELTIGKKSAGSEDQIAAIQP